MSQTEKERKLDLIWRKTGKDYKGYNANGQKTIMRWAKFGGGLIALSTIPDAEIDELYTSYTRK